ncbi:hypothetical protein ACQKLP_03905 [Chitinophaga sp. NPDC101104]|uniref:hypothetical protein n=1 Tax=Chitinophaga sp. NPDC101104 TaxID=3390561 RepID=UPI003D08FF62
MKKSNIILTILILILPVGILLTNFTLLAEYRKRNFAKLPMAKDVKIVTELPDFRYVSIDGKVKMEARMPAGMQSDIKDVRVSVGRVRSSAIQIEDFMKEYVRTRVSGDTLYVWFEAKYPAEWGQRNSSQAVVIYNCTLAGIRATDTHLSIDEWQQDEPVVLQVFRSKQLYMGNIRMPKMDLTLDNTEMYLGPALVDTLSYSLGPGSFLNLQPSQRVKVLDEKYVDKSAKLLPPTPLTLPTSSE